MFQKAVSIIVFISFIFKGLGQGISAGDIALQLKKLNTAGSVLYIAAHPDDENTRLISWLANEKCLRTAYLSLTRGDGGQNLIGKEQGDGLGLIRTQELLAARRTDGGQQFFTRAIDFGYSKNPQETFSIWEKDSILKDVVYIIRKFRPDAIICRFGTDGSGGHGHHTASALLAEEAFALAGDPTKFPELNALVSPWKPSLLAWNFWVDRSKMEGKICRMEVGGFNPLLGKSYGEIAAESRSMHKSQGFGVARNRGETFEYFKILKGECDTTNLFSGMDFSWNRWEGSQEVHNWCRKAQESFSFQSPASIIPLLVKGYQACKQFKDTYGREMKQKQIADLIKACGGWHVEAVAEDFIAIPGTAIKINFQSLNRSHQMLRLQRVSIASMYDSSLQTQLLNNKLLKFSTWIQLPENMPYTYPYWLRYPSHHQGLARVAPEMVGMPESAPALTARFDLECEGVVIPFEVGIPYKWVEPADGEKYRPLEVMPPLTLKLEQKAFVFTPGMEKKISVKLLAHKANMAGKLKIALPHGWICPQNEMAFELIKKGEEQVFTFGIKPGKGAENGRLQLAAEVNHQVLNLSLNRLNYPHIPIQTQLFPCEAQLVLTDLKISKGKIGYIPGAGDGVADGLRDVGYSVEELSDEQLMASDLGKYQAIVTGVRLYNVNERTRQFQPRLMEYVRNGGNLVVQYNTLNWISSVKTDIGPYPFNISRDRVTDEKAPVLFSMPGHPALNTPNKLSEIDFQNWVQERGIYFAADFSAPYQAPLKMKDPGEKDQIGALIIAPHGKGNFVYTGLAFFRQIPAGIPGAYRLMSNLIALPKNK